MLYDYQVTTAQGETYSLERYKGYVMVIVNTATHCGLAGQFKELESLYQQYKDQQFIVLGFPSNQFKQEIDSAEAALEACQINYGVTFPIHEIVDVNGNQAAPLFNYLKEQAKGSLGSTIKWNFTKFLIDRQGTPIKRFSPTTNPQKMAEEIEALL